MSTDTEACPPPTHKTCSACGEIKPLEEFYVNRAMPDGKSYVCKECQKSQVAEFHARRPFYNIMQAAKNRAKKSGVPFDIDEEYLEDIWTGHCPVFQTKLRLPGKGTKQQVNGKHGPSLDRIRPDRGYVRGNVIWISQAANLIKSNATSSDILTVGRWLEQTMKEIEQHEAD